MWLAIGVAAVPGCDGRDRDEESPAESPAAPDPEPLASDAGASDPDSPAGETSAQLTRRLLDTPFMQPDGVQVRSGLPPISLTPEVVDLGDIAPRTSSHGTLTLTNTGDQPLRIVSLRTTCACTVPSIESDTIAPGESIDVVLELEAQSSTGPNERYIMALFEGYMQPVQLIVQADVNYGVRTQVAYDPPGQSRVATIHLQSADGAPFSIISAGGQAPVFADGFDPESDEPRTEYSIRQDLSMYAAELLPKWFIIETDHATAALIDIPVPNYEAPPERRRHRFNLSEGRVVFGRMTPGERETASLRIVGGDLGPASAFVESVEWTNTDECEVEILSVTEDDGGLEVVVGVTPKREARGVLHGTVTIHAMGDARELDIMGRVVPGE